MTDLEDRGRSLEEAFFLNQNEKLRQKLREKKAREHSMEELAAASGISDPSVLDDLVDVGVSVDTLAAFSLVPLVQVGWASGRIEDDERKALLRAAHGMGVAQGSPAQELLESLLDHPPADRLFEVWAEYVGSLRDRVGKDELARLRDDVLARAREVAAAAGGFLGLGKVSDAEEQVLARIGAAFDS